MLRRGVFASHPFGHILTPPEPFRLQSPQPGPPEGFPDRSTCRLPDPHGSRPEDLLPCEFMVGHLTSSCNHKIDSRRNFLWIRIGHGDYLWITGPAG